MQRASKGKAEMARENDGIFQGERGGGTISYPTSIRRLL